VIDWPNPIRVGSESRETFAGAGTVRKRSQMMKDKMNRTMAVFTGLSRYANILSEIGTVALMILIAREVIWRYILNKPSVFSVEISEYIMIFITFMCAGWVLHKNAHVSMTVLTDRLPVRIRISLDIVTSLLTMGVCSVIIWKGAISAVIAFTGHYRSASLIEFPLWISYSIIPVGMTILFLQYVVRIRENILRLKDLTKIRKGQ
jgi:TRAP-type C4-dicarboxylate transport system permease small subunit